MGPADVIVVCSAGALTGGSWALATRAPAWRPDIGVFNAWDTALLLAILLVLPWAYVTVAEAVAVAAWAPFAAMVVYHLLRRIAVARSAARVASVALVLGDIGVGLLTDERSNLFLTVNGIVVALIVLGTATFVAASGVRARDVAVLAGALSVAALAGLLTSASELLESAGHAPLVPLLGWWDGSDMTALGPADLVVAALFPLAAAKAFGRPAGLVALATSLVAIALVMALAGEDAMGDWPPIVALGPLAVAQYVYWIRRCGRERTTREARALGYEAPGWRREGVTT